MDHRANRGLHAISQLTERGRQRVDRGVPKAVCVALAAYGALFSALILVHPFGGRAFVGVSDVAGIVPPIAAGVLALIAGERSPGHVRAGWRFVGAGCLAWGAGECVWAEYEVVFQQAPFPSLADAGYLTMLPLVALGLTLITSEGHGLSNSRLTLEGVALVLVITAFVWFFVLHPTYTESSASLLEKVIGAAYPIGDLVLCYAVVVAIQRQWGERDALVLMTLLAGLLLLVAADVGFAYKTLHNTYTETSLVNIAWPLGFLCIGLASVLSASWTLTYDSSADIETSQPWRQLLPAGLLIPLIVVGFSAFHNDHLSTAIPLTALTGLAALALGLRSAISAGLGRELEGGRARLLAWIEEERRKAA